MSAFVQSWKAELIASSMRSARLMVCPRCDVDVWTGLDNDVMAVSAIADAEPVSIEDGFRAVLDGRGVYSLIPSAAGHELCRRDEWNFAELQWPCLREHRCPPREDVVEEPRHPERPPTPVRKSRRQQRAEAVEVTGKQTRTPRRRAS